MICKHCRQAVTYSEENKLWLHEDGTMFLENGHHAYPIPPVPPAPQEEMVELYGIPQEKDNDLAGTVGRRIALWEHPSEATLNNPRVVRVQVPASAFPHIDPVTEPIVAEVVNATD